MASKRIERAYLEVARSMYSDFPNGEISDSESPDFLISGTGSQLGIEVRQLFQRTSGSEFTPRQVESFRVDTIRRAEKLYYKEGGAPVDVCAYWSHRPVGRQRADQIVRALAAFVRSNYKPAVPVRLFQEGIALPPGLAVINLARPLPGIERRWFAGGVGSPEVLTRDTLEKVIAEKEALVPSYRSKVAQVWLLLTCDLFPFSASFSVPDQIQDWKFDFSFDRVLLISREQSTVWSLSRL